MPCRGFLLTLALLVAVVVLLPTSGAHPQFRSDSAPRHGTDPGARATSVRAPAAARPGALVAAGWTDTGLSVSALGLFYPSLAYDGADGYVLLFGGCSSVTCTNPSNVTWRFADGAWSEILPVADILPVPAPPGRYEAQMTYDAADRSILLYGGRGASGDLTDTWEFSGGGWTRVATSTNPGFRVDASFVYDAADADAVLFGGYALGSNATWTYASGAWSEHNLSTAPQGRYGASMVYSAMLGEAVLFGGVGDSGSYLADTWLFRGGGWSPYPGSGPALRSDAEAGYDSTLGLVVLFGGVYVTLSNFPGVSYDDTWEFGSSGWVPVTTSLSPSGLFEGGMTFDGASGSAIEVGGCSSSACPSSETWVFGVESTVTLVGHPGGCGVSLGESRKGASSATVADEVYRYVTEPCPHYVFSSANGSGGVTTGGAVRWANVSGDGTLTSEFSPMSYAVQLLTTPSGCGSFTVGNQSYPSGAEVNLTYGVYDVSASGCAGESFSLWATNGTDLVVPDSLASTANLSVGGNGSVTAQFVPTSLTNAQAFGVPVLAWIAGAAGLAAVAAVAVVLRRRRGRPPSGPDERVGAATQLAPSVPLPPPDASAGVGTEDPV